MSFAAAARPRGAFASAFGVGGGRVDDLVAELGDDGAWIWRARINDAGLNAVQKENPAIASAPAEARNERFKTLRERRAAEIAVALRDAVFSRALGLASEMSRPPTRIVFPRRFGRSFAFPVVGPRRRPSEVRPPIGFGDPGPVAVSLAVGAGSAGGEKKCREHDREQDRVSDFHERLRRPERRATSGRAAVIANRSVLRQTPLVPAPAGIRTFGNRDRAFAGASGRLNAG